MFVLESINLLFANKLSHSAECIKKMFTVVKCALNSNFRNVSFQIILVINVQEDTKLLIHAASFHKRSESLSLADIPQL